MSIDAAGLNNDDETIEIYFYLLYNMILFYWFPPTEGYSICPQWSILEPERTSNFTIAFVIEHNRAPCCSSTSSPHRISNFSRGAISPFINEVLQFLEEMGPKNHHADRLHAISAIGKRWKACYALKVKVVRL